MATTKTITTQTNYGDAAVRGRGYLQDCTVFARTWIDNDQMSDQNSQVDAPCANKG